jgi:hypothetical protein
MGQKIGLKYVAICCVAVFLTFFFHELAHWTAGELSGFDMGLQLNLATPLREYNNIGFRDIAWTIAAGPLFTLLQASAFYLVMKRSNNVLLFPFLLTPAYMRLLAAFISFIKLNDEATISHELGIGAATIPAIMSAIMLLFTYDTIRRNKYTVRFVVISLVFIIIFSSILILSDQHWRIRVI